MVRLSSCPISTVPLILTSWHANKGSAVRVSCHCPIMVACNDHNDNLDLQPGDTIKAAVLFAYFKQNWVARPNLSEFS
jgi:hypothetical protein